MKINFSLETLLILIIVLINISSKAQQYIPFPRDNALWIVKFRSQYETKYIHYALKGDTVINDTTYSKLHEYYPGSKKYKFIGGIREEGKKVYYRGNYSGSACKYAISEQVLYDFNLNVGDFLAHGCWAVEEECKQAFENTGPIPQYGCGFRQVISIDSVFYSGKYRKRYGIETVILEPNGEIYSYGAGGYHNIIEGVGSDKFLFFPYDIEFEWGWRLKCFDDNAVDIDDNNCINVGIANNRTFHEIEIVPNPVSDISYIRMDVNDNLKNVTIYDLCGKTVKEILFSDNHNIQIMRSYFPSAGLYIMKIVTINQNLFVKKIVVE